MDLAYANFVQSWPPEMAQLDLSFRGYASILASASLEYATNCRNHIVSNFEKRCIDYFFIRFNDEEDAWHLPNTKVSEKRALAQYAYKKAAGLDATGPQDPELADMTIFVEEFASTIYLGPTPVTDESLSANCHLYLPWLYTVLQRLEQRTSIREPQDQIFASKGYIHRKVTEVSGRFNFIFYVLQC
jgi:hypothetical protein